VPASHLFRKRVPAAGGGHCQPAFSAR